MWQLHVTNNEDLRRWCIVSLNVEFVNTGLCEFVGILGIVTLDNGKEMKINTWIYIYMNTYTFIYILCVYGRFYHLALMSETPTHLFMESLTVMGVRLVLDKGGDSWWKDDFCTWFCMSWRCAISRLDGTGKAAALPFRAYQVVPSGFSSPLSCLGS